MPTVVIGDFNVFRLQHLGVIHTSLYSDKHGVVRNLKCMLTALPVTIKQNEQPHRMDRADGVLTKTNISISSILKNNLILCVVPWQRRDTQSKF